MLRRLALYFSLFVPLFVAAQDVPNLNRVWGDIDVDCAPWATNISRPNTIDRGLTGRHIALWQSHGRYYDNKKGYWKWQRPNLFCTTEDLFTQTIVVPYLIPMLTDAGAYVFTPRERDWQKAEVYVDNDGSYPDGQLIATGVKTRNDSVGFRFHTGNYRDGENPFRAGTALTTPAVQDGSSAAALTYYPEITTPGRYAVYVSYPYLEDAVDDVRYTVCHKGTHTTFVVNQQIGYGTWVYLGTFAFDAAHAKAKDNDNCVVLSCVSASKGTIGADAVRFGGGMGNIMRGGRTSGMARSFEGARYAAQWAGAPYDVYSSKEGENDYADDINARGLMVNWLAGRSCYMPTAEEGLGVPLEVSVAVHSDAGFHEDGTTIYGSMAIATTAANDGLLSAGITRRTSLDLAFNLLNNLSYDLRQTFGRWEQRLLRDRNYSETRIPRVPSAIIETLSHQSFPDMIIGQHPMGKFTIARSIYKTILRYVCAQHGTQCVVEPLSPTNFRLSLGDDNSVTLSWTAVDDPLEKSATPTSYNVYTAMDDGDFDNGQNITATHYTLSPAPGVQYNFRVTACNAGGESFPTATLSAYIAPEKARGTILIVDAFERLSAPFIIDNDTVQGFDLLQDEGVQRGLYAGWAGRQTYFGLSAMGQDGDFGLGACGNELAGQYIMGNEFNYVVDHARAIAASKRYNIVSCSLAAINNDLITDLAPYALVDLVFGLQKDDGQLSYHFKTFSPALQKVLLAYTRYGGALLTSGAYVGSDMLSAAEQAFLLDVLKLRYRPTNTRQVSDEIAGLGMRYRFYHTLNATHYAATHPDVLSPSQRGAICAMQYSDGTSAAVGYKGKYSCFTMGFPFECITDVDTKRKIMLGILAYLLK